MFNIACVFLVIPGNVKSYSYAMAVYIMADEPGIGANTVITRSRQMMDGHKMELFILPLSFIGWHLLASVTFGLAYIYVTPYIQATTANFYYGLKAEYDGYISAP